MWRAAANASNKQSRTANEGCSSRLIFERGANNPKPWRVKSYETETTALDLDRIFGTMQETENEHEVWQVDCEEPV